MCCFTGVPSVQNSSRHCSIAWAWYHPTTTAVRRPLALLGVWSIQATPACDACRACSTLKRIRRHDRLGRIRRRLPVRPAFAFDQKMVRPRRIPRIIRNSLLQSRPIRLIVGFAQQTHGTSPLQLVKLRPRLLPQHPRTGTQRFSRRQRGTAATDQQKPRQETRDDICKNSHGMVVRLAAPRSRINPIRTMSLPEKRKGSSSFA